MLGAVLHWFRYKFVVTGGAIHWHGLVKCKPGLNLWELSRSALAGYKCFS